MRKSSIAKLPHEQKPRAKTTSRHNVDVLKLKTLVEESGSRRPKKNRRDQSKFTLRIDTEILDKVREKADARSGNISANQWIAEAIEEKLARLK